MRWPAYYANFYSLQSNRKTRDGSNHPDRDAQFGYINAQTSDSLTAGQPAISVDTLVGWRLPLLHSSRATRLRGRIRG